MNEKKKQNQPQEKQVNVTVYGEKGAKPFKTTRSFNSRAQLLQYVKQRGVPGVTAIGFNNQVVVFDKKVVDENLIHIEHEYYLNPNLQTIDKQTHKPKIVPVDVIGRLIDRSK